MQLHWLPILYRIHYKILLLTFGALNGKAPQYLTDLLLRKDSIENRHMTHRSDNAYLLVVPRVKSKFGECSFSHSAPLLWNSLPLNCRAEKSISRLKSCLKTILFKKAFKI